MKNILTLLLLAFTVNTMFCQNVGIGTNAPNASAKLEISSTNSGLLIPRVALTISTAAAPITAPATSLLVYNTATVADVTPGYYYWNGTAWTRLKTGSTVDWSILGNALTNPATNFIGTSDAVDFVTRTSNIERMRVLAGGNIGIGITTPIQSLDVNGRFNVRSGVIQRGTTAINVTTDLGLYSQIAANFIRIATNAGPIKFYMDQGGANSAGTNAIVNIDPASGGGVKIAAQAAGGLNAGTPDVNAVLDLESTNKGILFPRMTTAQRDAIVGPTQGLTIYNTSTQCIEWWDTNLSSTNKWNSHCNYCNYAVTISANQTNLNFRTYLGTIGVPAGPYTYCVRINAGITISAAASGGNAFDVSTMPVGAKIILTNYGRIVGGGGNGGIAGAEGNTTFCSSNDNDGGAGGAAGHAIFNATTLINITNYGLIAGGGGGGGGGGGDAGCCSAGGGGGGGAGIPSGGGGGGRTWQCVAGTVCVSCSTSGASNGGNAGAVPVGIANAFGGFGGGLSPTIASGCSGGRVNGTSGGSGGSLGGTGFTPADIPCGTCPDCRVPGVGGAAGKAVSGGAGYNALVNGAGGLSYGNVD